MAVALVLDQVTLPQMGTVNLHLDYTLDVQISAEDARRKVHGWLVDQVSYMIRAGEPTLVIGVAETGEEHAFWRVPAILTATHLGDVGVAGQVDVAVDTGNMDNLLCCKERILQQARNLAATMPSYAQRNDLPAGYRVQQMQPTISHPVGNPLDLLRTIH